VIDIASLEYTQARLQARNAQRPSQATWGRMQASRGMRALLDAARDSALRPWVAGLTAQTSVHEIEAALRAHWRSLVVEVSSWMPIEWQGSVRWCAVLADLPTLQYLFQGGVPLPWMHNDPVYRPICDEPMQARAGALSVGALAPLAKAWDDPVRLLAAWRAEWRRRCPRGLASESAFIDEFERTLSNHLEQFVAATTAEAWLLRQALEARLRIFFRRAVLDAAAVFAFLGLSAIDLERLRGELARRAAFPERRPAS
jgi:hypothetical protein